MNLTQLQSPPKERARALFDLEPAALGGLLAAVPPPLAEKRHARQGAKEDRQCAVGGGRRRKLLPYQEVLLTLAYLRHNVPHNVSHAVSLPLCRRIAKRMGLARKLSLQWSFCMIGMVCAISKTTGVPHHPRRRHSGLFSSLQRRKKT